VTLTETPIYHLMFYF